MAEGPTISTHVLDTERGAPAVGVDVELYRGDRQSEIRVGGASTDGDGRVRRLLTGALQPGEYRVVFRIGGPFFREASITFVVADASRSYHVPLLLAPYS